MDVQTTVTKNSNPEADSARRASAQGLSNLAARILDQLSITSWLPSAVLVLSLVLLGNLIAHEADLSEALRSLLAMGVGQAVAVVGMIAVATVVTQAFEFESIRLLEGYWGARWPVKNIAAHSRSHYRRRFADLHRTALVVRADAAQSALEELQRRKIQIPQDWRIALKRFAEAVRRDNAAWIWDHPVGGTREQWSRHVEGTFALKRLKQEHRDFASSNTWEPYADPDLLARYNLINRQLAQMPNHAYRILPTRLGNVLRSYEEEVAPSGGKDVERYVQRRMSEIPWLLLEEHDQFRGRLDLYCALVLVSFSVAFTGLVMAPIDRGVAAIWFAAWIAMAGLSYRAALASAHGFGSVLLSIKERSEESATP